MSNDAMTRYKELVEGAQAACATPEKVVRIQVGSATCEHAAGAQDVYREFRKLIEASGRQDVLLRKTGCTGRCSREPIVGVLADGSMPVKYERVDREAVHHIFTSHITGGAPVVDQMLDGVAKRMYDYEVLFCGSGPCSKRVGTDYRDRFREELERAGIEPDAVHVELAGCFGACRGDCGPGVVHALVRPSKTVYRVKSGEDVARIVQEHIKGGRPVEDLQITRSAVAQDFFDLYGDVSFFNRQSRIALRRSGIVDPESLDEFLSYRGFRGLAVCLDKGDPGWVRQRVLDSKLRGRGGGGYPTGLKWNNAVKNDETTRYIICNADEGDPGAFMDRSMLESDPYNVVEGMAIGGYAIGASRGFVYIRVEYPLAIRRLTQAIDHCRERGLLGDDILGTGFSFDIELRLGAGAFVCGEETALIHSIEGERGQPRIRPPYPTARGLWGKPTVINNVETFANVPAVINYDPDWFLRVGTERSGGTKVFALAGKIRHTGLVEVPMGTTLREIVFDIGGGVADGKALKAVQTGGPAGGCIPADNIDIEVNFENLMAAGSIMGSGGMIVLDEDDCIVDVARFYMSFSQDESCGKCTPCREGTTRMLEILDRITKGQGSEGDIVRLERLARLVRNASLCGLGRAAPNPVLSTLEHFRDEYLAHVRDKECPARKCVALIRYEIDPQACVGCTLCAKNCPVDCIFGERRKPHVIDQTRCIKCGRCFEVCRFDAVKRL